jgi:sugar (pentulose or hexulose) kinase
MYFIGMDNGTKRTRTVVLNLESASLAVQSEQSYGLVPGLPQGPLGQDPSLCGHAVDHTVRDCLDQLGGLSRVAGIGAALQAAVTFSSRAENISLMPR